ncbi:MAG: hypothetical protein WCY19_00960 [Candidatus Gastranaerophilaceae bacterium]
MLLRKIYLKIWLFLYSIREILNGIVVIAMITTLLYLFLNNFIFEKIILVRADSDQIKRDYDSAINFYNISYFYYNINHFSKNNKEIYLRIPYEISICYLNENKKEQSIEEMLNAITAIQKQYGIFSRETAYFIRKYLIKYYLENNNIRLAKQEFNNLMTIYKIVGYSDSEMSDLICLKGDLYYQQKRYDSAMALYEQAYSAISTQNNIDYEILAKIVDRLCDYEIVNNNTAEAINIYQNSINLLKTSGWRQQELTAKMLLKLGDLYTKENNQTKTAIKCYEEAIGLIKKLPSNNYLKQNISEYLTTLKDLYNQDGQFHKVDEIDLELARKRRFSFLY